MIALNFPSFDFQIKNTDGKLYIFDILRKKHIFLTPEEWVRQHLIHFLIKTHRYPKSFIKLEGGLLYNELQKRTDALVFDSQGNPFVLIECKGANIPLTQDVLDQIATYNYIIKAPNLLITNGLEYLYCNLNTNTPLLQWTSEIPRWQ